jgi:hypothetical protein
MTSSIHSQCPARQSPICHGARQRVSHALRVSIPKWSFALFLFTFSILLFTWHGGGVALTSIAAGGSKRDEVLSFLKNNRQGLFSPDFLKIWLEKNKDCGYVYNFNGETRQKLF